MPIPVIAILAVGLLSVLWPGPKLDHVPPPSGGVFAPHMTQGDEFVPPSVKAPAMDPVDLVKK